MNNDNVAREPRPTPEPRRPYSRPTLVEFGSVSALTGGDSGRRNDGPGSKKLNP